MNMNRLAAIRRWGQVRRRIPFIALCLLALAVQPVWSFTLVPMVMEFSPSGRGATQAFRVENGSKQTIAVEVTMKTREIRPDGREVNEDAEEDFIVFPAQILLKAGEVQAVRVKWIGEARPDRELAYRIVAEQLPVNLTGEPESGVKVTILTRYLGSVYIAPRGVKPEVVLEGAEARLGENGERRLFVRLGNRGTRHSLLRDLKLRVGLQGRSVELGPESLRGLAGENLLAGGAREVSVPWPAELGDGEGPLEVSFTYSGAP